MIDKIALSLIAAIVMFVIGWNSYFIYQDLKRKRDKHGK